MLGQIKKGWNSKLSLALWSDRITVKKSTRKSSFELVYGKKARLLLDNLLPVHRFMIQEGIDVEDPLQERLIQLVELDEIKMEAQKQNVKAHDQMKKLYDKRVTDRKFEIDDWVLMWDSINEDKGNYGKFEALWLGPYVIMEKVGENAYYIQVLQETIRNCQYMDST
ncbi:uncharacterized protein LOC131874027 [Cryptomeria japonica]|uniref:uncharacterized protein LOC131874027 n=1 Tax=Cryptomeria japonica TaxID=3369 RepID=UPI0027DA580C|nr:uncharacterized protein LOC131874027 [Cryptomeria japonica]